MAHLGTVRAAGLWRLLHILEEKGEPGEVLHILRHWADRSTRILREARGLERGYLGHRDWFYHKLAMHLCRRYRQLVVEALDLRELASRERIADTPRLQQAAKYRHLVALSRLLTFLRQAAAKTGTDMTVVEPAYTTQECQVCGARVPTNVGEVRLVCPNGHQWDQDSNAARNLLMRAIPMA